MRVLSDLILMQVSWWLVSSEGKAINRGLAQLWRQPTAYQQHPPPSKPVGRFLRSNNYLIHHLQQCKLQLNRVRDSPIHHAYSTDVCTSHRWARDACSDTSLFQPSLRPHTSQVSNREEMLCYILLTQRFPVH